MKKRCVLQEKIIVMQAEHAKELNYWKSKYEKTKCELLETNHELEIVNLRHSLEIQRILFGNMGKGNQDDLRNTHSLKYENIPFTDSEISSFEIRTLTSKQNRNVRLCENQESLGNSRTQSRKNKTQRIPSLMAIDRVRYGLTFADIQDDLDDVQGPFFRNRSQCIYSKRSLSETLDRIEHKFDWQGFYWYSEWP
jgi:hypothetical protein